MFQPLLLCIQSSCECFSHHFLAFSPHVCVSAITSLPLECGFGPGEICDMQVWSSFLGGGAGLNYMPSRKGEGNCRCSYLLHPRLPKLPNTLK